MILINQSMVRHWEGQDPIGSRLIRTTSDPAASAALIKNAVRALDPDLSIKNFGWLLVPLDRALSGYLFDTQVTDPVAVGSVLLTFLIAGLLACLGPALRATTVDPLVALRSY